MTEYGIADVRGRSDRHTVEALLAIADSRFQARLLDDARAAHKLPQISGWPGGASQHAGTHRGRARRCPPRRHAPVFPLGTEMTETEQALIPCLRRLRSATPLGLLSLLANGLRPGALLAAEREGLARLGLGAPAGLKQRAMLGLVLGAMRASG